LISLFSGVPGFDLRDACLIGSHNVTLSMPQYLSLHVSVSRISCLRTGIPPSYGHLHCWHYSSAPPCLAHWLRGGSHLTHILLGLSTSYDPSDFCFQSSWDYRCEQWPSPWCNVN
jgi:hypothetical protein